MHTGMHLYLYDEDVCMYMYNIAQEYNVLREQRMGGLKTRASIRSSCFSYKLIVSLGT